MREAENSAQGILRSKYSVKIRWLINPEASSSNRVSFPEQHTILSLNCIFQSSGLLICH